jgi:hypothetical protein
MTPHILTRHSGAPRSGEPGIQKYGMLCWIPGSRALLASRNDGGAVQ